jgi:hypothetical protein
MFTLVLWYRNLLQMRLTRANLFIIHTENRICFCILGALHITSLDSLSRHMSFYSLYKVIYKIRQ